VFTGHGRFEVYRDPMRRTALVLALLAAFVAAQDSRKTSDRPDSRPGKQAFENALRIAKDAAVRGKFKTARDQVAELLRAHEGSDYVLARRVEISELVKSCCFSILFPDATPKSLMSGELLSWDPQSGAIKIRYTRAKMGDWQDGEVQSHPIRWRGPYSIELKGERYPEVGSDAVRILVCATEEAAIIVVPGAAAENQGSHQHWIPARLIAHEKGGRTELDKKEQPPCRGGKPYVVKVRVNDSQVVATYNDQSLLSGRRLKEWGHVAFTGVKPEELILEGKAEGAWIHGLVDQAREKNRQEFERKFDPKNELPAWLLSPQPAAKAGSVASDVDYPDTLTAAQLAIVARATRLLEKEQLAAGIVMLERMKPGELPEVTRSFLLARFYEDADRLGEAEALIEKIRSAAPKFWQADLVRARILVRTGRNQQAADVYQSLIVTVPNDCDVIADAALASLTAGRIANAKSIVDAAIARRVSCPELDHVNTLLVKAINGPPWPKRFEFQSQNFVVASDIDRKTCEDASKLLEDSYVAYSTWLDRVPTTGTDRFKVYLFAGEAGYQSWTRDLTGNIPQHTAGLYSPLLKILLIWNLPSRDDMMRTVRHEGFHQYLDRLVCDPPVWFNEGLAEYFENARLENGTWRAQDRHPQHAKALASGDFAPLSTFLFESREAFYTDAARHYAQAWAFVTFLRHSSPENKQLFQKLWSALRENVGAHAAVTRVFTPEETGRLEREFTAWVRSKL
jgi:hypothetical protein